MSHRGEQTFIPTDNNKLKVYNTNSINKIQIWIKKYIKKEKTHQSTGSPFSFLHWGVKHTQPVINSVKTTKLKLHIARVSSSKITAEVRRAAGSGTRVCYDVTKYDRMSVSNKYLFTNTGFVDSFYIARALTLSIQRAQLALYQWVQNQF